MLSVAFAAVRLGVLEILRTFSRTPNLHISKRFARATGVGLGEREMHLRRDAPATRCTCDEVVRLPEATGQAPQGAQAVASSGPPTSNTRSFAKQSRNRVRANCEEYPPTEGRCHRQSLEWCRKAPSESNLTSFTRTFAECNSSTTCSPRVVPLNRQAARFPEI